MRTRERPRARAVATPGDPQRPLWAGGRGTRVARRGFAPCQGLEVVWGASSWEWSPRSRAVVCARPPGAFAPSWPTPALVLRRSSTLMGSCVSDSHRPENLEKNEVDCLFFDSLSIC